MLGESMRKNIFLLILLFFVFALALFGCKQESNNNNPEDNKPVLSVSINYFELLAGESATITPTVTGVKEELVVLFSSENPAVATVDETGVIEAMAPGETTIILIIENYEDIIETITVVVSARVPEETLTLNGPDTVYAGETIQLTAFDYYSEDNKVIWESKTPSILKVDQNGVVTGLQEGKGVIRINSWINAEWVEKEITVLIPAPESVEIDSIKSRVTYSSLITLIAKVTPAGAKQEVTWSTSDADICLIDDQGKIKPLMPGEVTIKAVVNGTEISGLITFKVEPTLMELLERYNIENPLVQNITVYGSSNYQHKLISSVNHYLNQDLVIIESLLPTTNNNRPGNIQSETKYITVHDTGNSNKGAGAKMHNSFIHSDPAVSWHYSVGNDGIYHHLPNNEIAWHAGDGTGIPYESYDSGIPYTDKKKPAVTITTDGYYALDGVKSNVKVPRKSDNSVPKTSEINDLGIEITKGKNGNWFIGKTWWSNTFKRIGNYGGNLNSISIESCVDQGSDIFLTWQILAKLVAKLIEENGLGFGNIVQHHYFSGKDCPMTMRHSKNFGIFLKMVEIEYFIRTMFKHYTIEFLSDNPQYIDNRGRIIKLPLIATRASYSVTITNTVTKQLEKRTFFVNLPAE